jgi:hypothetical protein
MTFRQCPTDRSRFRVRHPCGFKSRALRQVARREEPESAIGLEQYAWTAGSSWRTEHAADTDGWMRLGHDTRFGYCRGVIGERGSWSSGSAAIRAVEGRAYTSIRQAEIAKGWR